MKFKLNRLNCALIDANVLYFLQKVEERSGSLASATEARMRRQRENAVIQYCVDHKEPIPVVWSGMDCDCVRYSGDVSYVMPERETDYRYVDADPRWDFGEMRKLVDKHIEHTYHWADGPCSYSIVMPDEAHGISYTSRDLALEAFENGHPHCIQHT